MPLVLGHMRLDLRQFPDLVPQRLGVAPGELLAAASALGRLQRLHLVAVLGGDQRSLVFLMPRLSAPFLLRPTLRGRGFRVGMHRAGRQRGVLGRFSPAFQLLDPCLQSGNLCQQQADDGLGFRRLASDDFFRNSQRHATVVAEHRPPCPDHFSKKTPPGCERLRSGDANKAAARNGGCDRRGTHVAYRQVGFADDSRIAASRRGLRCEQPGRGQRTGVTSARCCKVDLDDPDDRAFHDQDARAYIGAGSATPRPINPTMIETQRRHASVERTGVCRLGRQVIDDAVGAERQ